MVVRVGGVFERREKVLTRLQQGPGDEAQREVAVTANGPRPSRWSLRTIRVSVAEFADYTLSGIWRALNRLDLRLRSARVQLYSPDFAYAEKERHLLDCLEEAVRFPDEVVVLFIDEMGYARWPTPARDWAPAAPVDPPCAECGGGNNRQWRIIGALNARTGRVDYRENYIVGREQVIRFHDQLDRAYPTARRIYLVEDNWSIHRHPDVEAARAALPRLETVWLPTYAAWMNPIEKLWRWLRQDVLKLHRLAHDWTELRHRVNAFLDQFATGSHILLRYVGLLGEGKLAQALR
jgi:hypothetical protein